MNTVNLCFDASQCIV